MDEFGSNYIKVFNSSNPRESFVFFNYHGLENFLVFASKGYSVKSLYHEGADLVKMRELLKEIKPIEMRNNNKTYFDRLSDLIVSSDRELFNLVDPESSVLVENIIRGNK